MIRRPAVLFGVPIDDVTMDECVERIHHLVDVGRARGVTQQIATVNVDFLVNALADPGTRTVLQRAALCIPDGAPVLWGARAVGLPLRERVAGADLVPALASDSVTSGRHVHLFGGRDGSAERAAELLRERFPGARVTGDSGPFVRDVRDTPEEVLRSIEELDPDVLCVAFGNPKQEHWIAAHRDRLRTPVMIGVGGTVDFIVGHRRRAPRWLQRIGLEWVARAAQEPARLGKRYAKDAVVYFPRLAAEVVRQRRWARGAALAAEVDAEQVRLGAAAGSPTLPRDEVERALSRGARLEIDVRGGGVLHGAAIAEVAGLARVAGWHGAAVTVHADGPAADQLARLGLG